MSAEQVIDYDSMTDEEINNLPLPIEPGDVEQEALSNLEPEDDKEELNLTEEETDDEEENICEMCSNIWINSQILEDFFLNIRVKSRIFSILTKYFKISLRKLPN